MASIARHLAAALLALGLAGLAPPPAEADDTGTTERLRAGTLLEIRLGDSLEDFRRIYRPEVTILPKLFGVKNHFLEGSSMAIWPSGRSRRP